MAKFTDLFKANSNLTPLSMTYTTLVPLLDPVKVPTVCILMKVIHMKQYHITIRAQPWFHFVKAVSTVSVQWGTTYLHWHSTVYCTMFLIPTGPSNQINVLCSQREERNHLVKIMLVISGDQANPNFTPDTRPFF